MARQEQSPCPTVAAQPPRQTLVSRWDCGRHPGPDPGPQWR